jgi:hypothetical protein
MAEIVQSIPDESIPESDKPQAKCFAFTSCQKQDYRWCRIDSRSHHLIDNEGAYIARVKRAGSVPKGWKLAKLLQIAIPNRLCRI